ncbi:MAG: ATP-binding protein [Myxococcota bacterium]|nr:ATP-binding protein [Myxococcota bacterium]MDW8362319.1 ATP-binding protein [Myxococcales bacterium]
MSPTAALTVCAAAVYGGVAIFFGVLHALRQRQGRVAAAFAWLNASLCVYAAGAAVLASGVDTSTAAIGIGIKGTGAYTAAVYTVELCRAFGADVRRGWLHAAYAAGFAGLLVVASGELVNETGRLAAGHFGIGGPSAAGSPPLSAAGMVVSTASVVPIAPALVALWRTHGCAAPSSVRLALLLNSLVGAHDGLVHAGWLASSTLLEHTALLNVFVMSASLLDGFARARTELAHRTRELVRRREALRRTEDELVRSEQLAALGEMSAVIAHELRNPLTVIGHAASGLRRPGLDASERADLLGILDEEADRLNRLVTDLVAMSRPLTPERRPVRIDELARRSLEDARAALGPAVRDKVHTEIDVCGDADGVEADPDLLRQALVNLIDNAIKAMPSGGRLAVRARRERDAVVLIVEDTGVGMDVAAQRKAGTPFYTTRKDGTGLGLAIVERIARAHGGSIQIDSHAGRGTRVALRLPQPPIGHAATEAAQPTA